MCCIYVGKYCVNFNASACCTFLVCFELLFHMDRLFYELALMRSFQSKFIFLHALSSCSRFILLSPCFTYAISANVENPSPWSTFFFAKIRHHPTFITKLQLPLQKRSFSQML